MLWYDVSTGGVGVSIAPVPQTAVSGTVGYYVSQTLDNCESDRRVVSVLVKEDCPSMPVTLSSFNLVNQENMVLVSWETASEINADRFEIERSSDPKNGFTRIASMAASDSPKGGTYNYRDTDLPSISDVYYRLKMIDRDESFVYSRIRNIKQNFSSLTTLYPNPTSDVLNIQTYDWPNVIGLKIRDTTGKIADQRWGKNISNHLTIQNLPSSIYRLEIVRKNSKSNFITFVVVR